MVLEEAAGRRKRSIVHWPKTPVFDLVAARTGLREHEAIHAGYSHATSQSSPDDHKAYSWVREHLSTYPTAVTRNV